MTHRQIIANAVTKFTEDYGIFATMTGDLNKFWNDLPDDHAGIFIDCKSVFNREGMLKKQIYVSHRAGVATDVDGGECATYRPNTVDIFHKLTNCMGWDDPDLKVYAGGPGDGFAFVITLNPFKVQA
jgi:hypothetical protein